MYVAPHQVYRLIYKRIFLVNHHQSQRQIDGFPYSRHFSFRAQLHQDRCLISLFFPFSKWCWLSGHVMCTWSGRCRHAWCAQLSNLLENKLTIRILKVSQRFFFYLSNKITAYVNGKNIILSLRRIGFKNRYKVVNSCL